MLVLFSSSVERDMKVLNISICSTSCQNVETFHVARLTIIHILFNKQIRKGLIRLPVILFGILGSYLFLHIWENIILKLGKKELKYMKLGK